MSRFRSDCSQCCGLCCVAPAFFAIQGFGADKPAHTPCDHLDSLGRCGIHQVRDASGYTACAGFDCYGAGQWVTQVLYGGATWSESPEVAEEMFRAYRLCLQLFELAAMLEVAIAQASPSMRSELCARRDAIVDLCKPHRIRQGSTDVGRLRREVRQLCAQVLSAS